MPKYKVNMAKTIWLTIEVEADNEDAALNEAYQEAPGMCAQCCGWGRKWGVSGDDEWRYIDDFIGDGYDPEKHGHTVEKISD